MARKSTRKWNPSQHPRDARGRFTRSSTRVMKGSDTNRARKAMSGFTPAKIGAEAEARAWIERKTGKPLSEDSPLSRYLAGGWRETNPAIRSQKTPPPEVAGIDAEFAELDEDVMLRRQVPLQMFAHIPVDDLVGMKVRDAAYASTSLDRPDAGPSAAGAVTMHIAAPVGTLAFVNGPDGEILLARDTEIAVTRAEPNGSGGWDLYGAIIPKTAVTKRGRPADKQDGETSPAPSGTSDQTGAPATDGNRDADGGDGGRGSATQPRAAATPDDQAEPAAPDSRAGDGDTGQQTGDETPAAGTSAPDGSAPATTATPDAAPDDGPLGEFSRLDRERIRVAVEDHAARIYASPMVGGSKSDAARYVSEGPLGKLAERDGLGRVWKAVEQILDDQPELLTRTPQESERAAAARAERVDAMGSQAAQRLKGGDYAGALALIDQAEQVAPDHLTGKPTPTRSWDDLRSIVRRRQEQDQQAADRPAAGDTTPDAPVPDGDQAADAAQAAPDAGELDAPTDTGEGREWIAPADGALAELAPVDRERVRIAVEDNAARIFRTPMMGGTAGNVARYVAEGRDLSDVTNRYGFRPTVDAVSQILADRPELMDRTDEEANAARMARTADATARAEAASVAMQAGDFTTARAELDAGEAIDPGWTLDVPGPAVGWAAVRRMVDDAERERGTGDQQQTGNAPAADTSTPDTAPTGDETPAAGTPVSPDALSAARETLAASVASGVAQRETLGGGSTALVELVTLNDGSRAVFKHTYDNRVRRAGEQQDAEELGPLALAAFGVRAPAVHRGGPTETYAQYIDGKTGMQAWEDDPGAGRAQGERVAATDAGRLLGLADVVLGNVDRNAGNWMLDGDGELVGIDHGDTFLFPRDQAAPPKHVNEFMAPYVKKERGVGAEWAEHDISPADIAAIRARLAELRPEFVRLGRAKWHDAVMVRLQTVGVYATGDRNRIATGNETPAAGTSAPADGDRLTTRTEAQGYARGLTDDELRAASNRKLSQPARVAVNAELRRRGLRAGEAGSRLDAAAGGFTSPPVPEITGDMTGDERRAAMREVGAFLYRVELHLKDHEPKRGYADYYAEEMRNAHDEAEHMRELVLNTYEAADLIPERMGRLNASIKTIDAMARARARRAELTRSANPDPANNPDDAVLAIQDVLNSTGNRQDKGMLAAAAGAIEGGVPIATAATLVGNVANQPRTEAGGEEWTQRLRDLHAALTAPGRAPEAPREVSRLTRDQYVTVSGRKSGTTNGHTATGYVAAVTPTGVSTETLVTLTEYPGGYGRKELVTAYSGGTATPATPPDNPTVVLWKNARTGRPVPNPGQAEIVRKQVVRDTGRETVVRGMLDAQAAERRAPAAPAAPATPDAPTGTPTPAAGTSAPSAPEALTVAGLERGDYVTVTDHGAVKRTATGYVDKISPTGKAGEYLVHITQYPDGHGQRDFIAADGAAAVTLAAPPNPARVALWKDARTGRPVLKPTQAAVISGQVVHDTDREEQVRAAIANNTGRRADPAAAASTPTAGAAPAILPNGRADAPPAALPDDQAAIPQGDFRSVDISAARLVGHEGFWARVPRQLHGAVAEPGTWAKVARVERVRGRVGNGNRRLEVVGYDANGGMLFAETPNGKLRAAAGYPAGSRVHNPAPSGDAPATSDAARAERAEDMASQAAARMQAGDYRGALDLVDQAEQLAPGHLIGNQRRSWDDLRDIVRRRRQEQALRDGDQTPAVDPGVPYAERRDRLAAAVAEGVDTSERVGNPGAMAESVDVVTFRNGARAIRKTTTKGPSGKAEQDKEELGAALAAAVGAPAPAVHRTGDREIYAEYVNGRTGNELLYDGQLDRDGVRQLRDTDAGRLLGLADLLMDNNDRHSGNWMVDADGRVVGIDHGGIFYIDSTTEGPESPPGDFHRNFSEHFIAWQPNGSTPDGWADNDLTPADVAEIRRRVEALRPEFERLGHTRWHDYALARLDAIAPYATGDRNRIAAGDDLGYPTPAADTSTPDTTPTGDETPAAGTSAPAAPTKATFKGHGSPETFVFYFGRSDPKGEGRTVRAIAGHMIRLVDVETGEEVAEFGRSTKFWAAPAPAGDQRAGDEAPAADATAPDAPAAPADDRATPEDLIAGREALAASVETGRAQRERIGGGVAAESVHLVTFNDGSRAVRKVTRDTARHTATKQADAEELGPLVLAAFGVRTAAVYRGGDNVTYAQYIDGHTGMEDWESNPDHAQERADRVAASDDGRLMGLADLVMSNPDRHEGNWMLDEDGRLYGIDHGYAFANIDAPENPPRTFLERMNAHWIEWDANEAATGWADNDLTPADIAEARRRLEALRPEFERLDRADWHDFALARLDAIAPHATGGRNRIADGDDTGAPTPAAGTNTPSGRRADVSPVDAAAAAALAPTVNGDDDQAEYMRRALSDPEEIGEPAQVYVARTPDGDLAGAVSVVDYDEDMGGPYSKIEHMGARGAGTELVGAAIQHAVDRDHPAIYVEPTDDSAGFWERQGFTSDPLGLGSDTGMDAAAMRRRLDEGGTPAAGTSAPNAPDAATADEDAAYEIVRRGHPFRGMSDENLVDAGRGARRAGDDDALERIDEEQTRRQDARHLTPDGAAKAAARRAAARQARQTGNTTPAAGTSAPNAPEEPRRSPDLGGGVAAPAPTGPDSGPAQQADMFGGVTDFVPAPRAALGMADRPNVGRERAIAAVQQLGMFDIADQQQMDGQMAMLDALMAMPETDTPAPPAPPTPAPSVLAGPVSIVPDDLSGWNDEQLAELFRTVTEDDAQADADGAARIFAEWERREAAMADLVASVPDDLTPLSDDDLEGMFARVTGDLGTMDHPTVDRMLAELERRLEADRVAAENAPKRALLARPLSELTDDEVETAAGYASDLSDPDALARVVAEMERRDAAREATAHRERLEREAQEAVEREAALEAARAAEREAAVEAARVQRDRMVDAMAAAQDAAIVPAYDNTAVGAANTALGEDGLRALYGDEVVDEWVADVPGGTGNTDGRWSAIQRKLIAMPASERVRLVAAAAEQAAAKEFADYDDRELHTVVSQGMFSTEPLTGPAPVRERGRRAGRETNRRKVEKLRADSAREFRQYQMRAMAAEPATLTDVELQVAPALVTATGGGDDYDVPGRLAALRAEAQRRELAAAAAAEAKAAGPAGPARYRNTLEEYDRARRLVQGRNDKDIAAQDRLRRAQATVYGLPEDADAKAIKVAERKDPRPVVDQAAQVMAWFRHLGQYEGVDQNDHDWYRGKPDDPDVPDTPTPEPPANVSKADEVWQQIHANARQEVNDGRFDTAVRLMRAIGRTYRVHVGEVENTLAGLQRAQNDVVAAMREDQRTEKQRAADYIANFRVLAAEDGVDPSDTLRYGPPDKGGRRPRRIVWRDSTPEEVKRIDALVARGWDWFAAYAEVHGIDPDAADAEMARSSGGRSGMSEKQIRQAYAEWVELQYQAAEAAANGYLLSPRAQQVNARRQARSETLIDARDLFSGPWSTARVNASEELLRWWGENQRMTYADFKAQLLGGDSARAARERMISAGKGNEFA